jgi:CRISPR-associated protein Csb1
MEEALQQAVDEGRIKIPVIEVDFRGNDLLTEIGKITSLQAPHRIADEILRYSLHGEEAFRKSEVGKRLDSVSLWNATPLYQLCPTALIFGIWDSTGPRGGLGAKFARAIVSEIVGIDAVFGVKTSSRIDPLQVRAAVKVKKGNDGSWEIIDDPKTKGTVSPSEVNHGNIPPDISENAGGVTISSAEQMIVLSLPALRRLHFPIDNTGLNNEVDQAGRIVLAALSLCAAALASEKGFDLRSRCLLWPSEGLTWEILDKPGEQPLTRMLDMSTAITLLEKAVATAKSVGLNWREDPLVLKPCQQLVELVKRSQELTAQTGEAGGNE